MGGRLEIVVCPGLTLSSGSLSGAQDRFSSPLPPCASGDRTQAWFERRAASMRVCFPQTQCAESELCTCVCGTPTRRCTARGRSAAEKQANMLGQRGVERNRVHCVLALIVSGVLSVKRCIPPPTPVLQITNNIPLTTTKELHSHALQRLHPCCFGRRGLEVVVRVTRGRLGTFRRAECRWPVGFI